MTFTAAVSNAIKDTIKHEFVDQQNLIENFLEMKTVDWGISDDTRKAYLHQLEAFGAFTLERGQPIEVADTAIIRSYIASLT